jgi:hypothetical protein
MSSERKFWQRQPGTPLHHEWLPEDDDANKCREKYWLPTPEEIWEHARQLRENRKCLNDHSPSENTLCRVAVRERPL